MPRKIISYSLWGNSKLYCQNMLINIELAKKIYPDFEVLVYIAENCPVLPLLKRKCDVVIMPESDYPDRNKEDWTFHHSHTNMFWRYYIIDELEKEDVVLFRDADSHLSLREAGPVRKWIESEFSAIRFVECEAHLNSVFMGGLWGVKGGVLEGIKESINQWIEIYHTFNHPWMFVDLTYHNQILAPMLVDKTMSWGYNEPFLLSAVKEEEMIGYVKNGEWRNIVFSLEEYYKEEIRNIL